MSTQKHRTLDVRPLLKRGEEPFSAIRKEVDSLKPDEGLILLSPFLPSPLIEHLKTNGFSARPQCLADGSWQTIFSRE
ncbi:MAG: DUF2249 domain-containing protein [Nibricoccus sp.]